MIAQHARARSFCVAALLFAGCGDDAVVTADAAIDAPDAATSRQRDAGPPVHRKTGASAPPFVPAAPPDPIPAFNDQPADAAVPDATIASDSGQLVEPHDGCIALAAGDAVHLDGELDDQHRWLRIDPENGCPATLVTADDVAFASYVICEANADRVLNVSMLGTDQLPAGDVETVADPLLVAYADEGALQDDPFDCLAANDDGTFDGFVSNSARIESLALPAGMRLVVVASSMEAPEQHGIGRFAIELSAQ